MNGTHNDGGLDLIWEIILQMDGEVRVLSFGRLIPQHISRSIGVISSRHITGFHYVSRASKEGIMVQSYIHPITHYQ